MHLSRRSLIRSSLVVAATPALGCLAGPLARPALAQDKAGQWVHGLSLFGDLHYPSDFKRFEYVNPNAPKGGVVRLLSVGTFDNFNIAVDAVRGSIATGMELIHDTLTAPSQDEVATDYGLLVEAMKHPEDFSSVTYRLRANARWHDGKPVTVGDVIYGFETLKKQNPHLAAYYQHVVKAAQTGEGEVTFTFDQPGNRELPQIVGQLLPLPKHYWEGTDANGKKRAVNATTLEPPLGCGPYRIKQFEAGRSVVFERVKDYWGKDLPVCVGQNNFDEIRYEYFRDPTTAIEALKGDQVDWREESNARAWATAYDFPAVKDNRFILEEFPINNVGRMQGFVLNLRRDKFKDVRVRQAFNYAFDFDEMNKQLFFGQYRRIVSYFDGTELASSGLPQGAELEILNTVKDKVPPEVFTTAYTNPTGGGPEKMRANLVEGRRLLKAAGYDIRDRRLVNVKTGEPFTVEFLTHDPNTARVILFYRPSLERLGITISVRTVDDAQYENRLRSWDYDIISRTWAESLSPGNEQRNFWGSAAADIPGSRNYIGIKNPAVDALIGRVVFAKGRDDLVAAIKALDRVLLWNHYIVPLLTYGKIRSAHWDRFSHPEPLPKYGLSGFPTLWWWDQAKAAKAGPSR